MLRNKRIRSTTLNKLEGLLFLSPWLIGFFVFMAFPLAFSLYMSFHQIRITPAGLNVQYRGLSYYKTILFEHGSILYNDLIPFLRQAMFMIPIIVIFALLVAIMLNYKFPGRTLFRTIFFLPVIFSTGEVIQTFYDQGEGSLGFLEQYDLNSYLSVVLPPAWSSTISGVLDSFILILWYSGVQILICLAGRQTIPASVYEAARIDGASPWESFWKITLPAMVPFIFLNTIYTVVDLFTFPWNPIMERVTTSDYGLSSALVWIYFGIILLFLLIVFFGFHRFTRAYQLTK
ncbi:carbohydrate ABC transporter permease [Paenibacillus lemnae]|uniref:Sugar ABC transporter permease n=1 Tax=Paenibacillus lemnae TaxID=1330551 RepID=A0A848M109_PAELE|nr:sugar ABC transporter permease [Paenibacillus lemnae]NMO94618.1 sugar ABC transporter permease [Paenibacillus lemnae]